MIGAGGEVGEVVVHEYGIQDAGLGGDMVVEFLNDRNLGWICMDMSEAAACWTPCIC